MSKLLSQRSRIALIIYTLFFTFIWLFPPNYLYFLKGLSSYLPLHMFMEVFSIIVAVIVFSVGWEAYGKGSEKPGNIIVIAVVFLAVALIDFAHTLSFAGMPPFVTHSDPEKAIFFWLSGRFLVAFGMLYIVMNAWKPFKSYITHYVILACALLFTALIYWIGLWYWESLPHTFIPGKGLTPLKIYLEWLVVAILGVSALFLIKRMFEKQQEYDAERLLMAIYIMILSEIFFMLYSDVTDLYNFVGHVYKVIAYYYIYRAIFVENIQKPYRELEEANTAVSDLYNNAPCGYHSLDKDGIFVMINDTELSWLGYTRDEVVGKMKFSDIATSTSREVFKKNFPVFKEHGWIKDLEFELVRKDGTIFPVLASATAIKDSAGNFLMSRSTIYDITDLKHAEDELQEKDRHSQSLLRLSKNLELAQTYGQVVDAAREEVRTVMGYQNIWVYLFTDDKKYAYALAAGGSMSEDIMSEEGTAKLTISGDPMLEEIAGAQDIVVVEDAQTDPRTDKKIVAQLGNRTIVNVPIIFFDRHMGSVGSGTFGDEGVRVPTKIEEEYLRALASHLAVTLDRIHLLVERQKAEKALRLSEESLKEAQRIAHLGSWHMDLSTNEVYWSEELYKMYGYNPALPPPLYTDSMKLFTPQSWELLNTSIERAVKTGIPYEIELEMVRIDGTKAWMQARGERVDAPDGTPTGLRGATLDITERKKAEAEVRKLNRIYRMLSDCNQSLVRADDENKLIADVCKVIIEEGGYRMVWVGYPQDDEEQTVKPVAYAGYEDGYLSQRRFSWGDNEYGRGPTGMAIRTGNYVTSLNYDTDPMFAPWKKEAKKRGYTSSVAFPLVTDGKPFGALSIYGGISDVFDKEELNLLQELASDLAFGIMTIRTRADRELAEKHIIKINRLYRILSTGNESLVRAKDENELISNICKIIVDEGGYRMVWVGYAQNDQDKTIKPMAYAGYEDGYLSQMRFSWGDNPYGYAASSLAIKENKYHVIPDFSADTTIMPWKEEAMKRGYATNVAFPLVINEKPMGALIIYGSVPGAFNQDEILLLGELASDLSYGIAAIRTRIGREHIQVMLNEAQRITHIGSWELDLINNVLTWSDEIYRMFEIDPAKFGASYEAFLDAIHPDDRESVNFAYTNSLKTKQPYSIEHRLLFHDGHIKYVQEQCETYYDKDGKPLRSVGTVQDITERKLAEEAFMYLNQKNELILNSAGEGIYGTDVEGNITFVNPAAAKILGFSVEEMIGKNSHHIFHHTKADGQPYPISECPLYKSLKEGGIHRGENEVFWTKAGQKFYVEHINTPLAEKGQILGAVVVFRDITERKLAQEALRHAYAYNRSLIEASLDPLVTISPDGKITDVNAATEIITGHFRSELVGTDFSDYFSEPEKAKAGYHQVFEAGFVKDYSLEIRDKDGRLTPVIYNASLYRDEDGKITGVFAAARDITKLKAAEMALHELNDRLELLVKQRTSQLEVTNKELEAFTYSVSHDLRAPLRAIDGFSAAVMEDYGDKVGDDGKDYLQRVRSASQKMNTLIDDLLSLSRLTRGELNKTTTNLSDIASEVIKTLREAEPDRNIEVSIAENMVDEADPHFMEIVFTNLLNNAWKFTSKKEKAKIEFNFAEKDGKKIYCIKDNGAGFDMNYASKLFQPFQRLHTVEEFPGTGIGLATVYRIIKKHGGEIWAEGKVDEGATFYFTLRG